MDIRTKLQDEWSDLYKEKSLHHNNWILNIFQRVGKIRTTLLAIDKMNLKSPKILVTYPFNDIKDSWLNDIVKFGYEHFNIEYVNYASLDKYLNKSFDFFIIDEGHLLTSEERIKNAEVIINNSKYNILLTGTLLDNKRTELKLLFNFDVLVKYTKEQAINDGIVADYKIQVIIVDLDNTIKRKNSKGKLITEKDSYNAYTWVIKNKPLIDKTQLIFARNRLLQNSIAKQNCILKCLKEYKNQRVIVFTGFSKSSESLNIPFYHSKCKNDNSLIAFNNKKFNHLALATKGQIGITYKDLDIVILSNFVTDSTKNEQGLTRASIKDYGNKVSKFIIICTNTETELKKLKLTLEQFDKDKIEYI